MPLLVVNAWLVVVTYTSITLTERSHTTNSNEWDWLRGALATVDLGAADPQLVAPPRTRAISCPPTPVSLLLYIYILLYICMYIPYTYVQICIRKYKIYTYVYCIYICTLVYKNIHMYTKLMYVRTKTIKNTLIQTLYTRICMCTYTKFYKYVLKKAKILKRYGKTKQKKKQKKRKRKLQKKYGKKKQKKQKRYRERREKKESAKKEKKKPRRPPPSSPHATSVQSRAGGRARPVAK